ncbi:hypothetical protein KRR39_18835 [Nocardioides panacis]|uniref:Uncharacterized protein n=1 Tax=Nocardioides panacis TaxID=2849501 RepID=A0A975XZI6_9ACTN|nr:hypothetical protein [Nocardioides panacis]QWZ07476.1 hypothetical protein KRR39_18835 [Nocardioides panacis]
MPDAPTDDGDERSSDTSKLELPSLKLPGFGRRRARSRSTTGDEVQPRDGGPAAPAQPVAPPVAQPLTRPVTPPVAPAERAAEPAETAPFVVRAPEPAQPSAEPDESWLEDTAVAPEHGAGPGPAPEAPGHRTARRRPRLPPPAGGVAALVTGALVGLAGALLTYLSLRGCEAVRGTESCGGPGLLLLVVILGLMVLLGSVVLAALRVSEPRGTSLLAVGVLAVVVLLVPQEALFSAWTFLAVPVMGAAAYALARWVTHLHVETPPERGPAHDVR